MARIFWLASYPKSGNTWMRILLINYLRNSNEPADINRLEESPIASDRTWFDEWVGVEASALDKNTIEMLRPGVYRCMAREEQESIYMKVHDAWRRTARGEGLFPADVTGGVIYILRNPLDLASSCANHWGQTIEDAVNDLCDENFALGQLPNVMYQQLSQFIGLWSSHVRSWLDESGLPVLLIRYEDLHQDPERYFGEVVRFCGLPWDAERLRRAIRFSSFSELRGQEHTKEFRERLNTAHGPFFRRGQAGSWREELEPHLADRLITTHGETMRRFGYLDENNQPV